MNPKILRLSVLAVGLVILLVVVASCGKRGDPVPPGDVPERRTLF